MTSKTRVLAATCLAVAATGCTSITEHRGYLMDEVLVNAVQPGLDNQASVQGTLGKPTLTSQFGPPVWYYVSSRTSQKPFNRPDIASHSVLAVHFDEAGNVISAERTGMDRVVQLSPDGDETPTLGTERSFLQDLFGNIGTVGTGMGGAGGPPGS